MSLALCISHEFVAGIGMLPIGTLSQHQPHSRARQWRERCRVGIFHMEERELDVYRNGLCRGHDRPSGTQSKSQKRFHSLELIILLLVARCSQEVAGCDLMPPPPGAAAVGAETSRRGI